VKDKLEQMKENDKAAQAEALKEAMRQLRQPGPGPLDEFTKSLSRGEFSKAKEQLSELEKKLADSNMSPEARGQAKQQAANLAEQLEKLSKNQEELAKKLQEAGLDKKAAEEALKKALSDPEALKKALEQAKNLTEQQKQELMQMCKSGQQAGEQCQNMSE